MRRFEDDRDVERLLRRYATEQLSPSPAARGRIRARVERVARRPLWSAAVAARERRGGAAPRRGSLRRAGTVLVAASLALVLAFGGTLAVAPGGPLYPVRLWAEALLDPMDDDARALAGISRLEARLAEAAGAAERQDGGAASAALDAYQGLLPAVFEAAGSDPERLEWLGETLARHLLVLERLGERVPAPARPALERAIEKSDRTVRAIRQGKDPGRGEGAGDRGRGQSPGGTSPPEVPAATPATPGGTPDAPGVPPRSDPSGGGTVPPRDLREPGGGTH